MMQEVGLKSAKPVSGKPPRIPPEVRKSEIIARAAQGGVAAASQPCADGEAAVPPHVHNLYFIMALGKMRLTSLT